MKTIISITFICLVFNVKLQSAKSLPNITDSSELEPDSQDVLESEVKVYGSEEAVPHSIPYQAIVFSIINVPGYNSNTYFCGGSLISQRYVLTAAHCIPRHHLVYTLVHLGIHDRTKIEKSRVSILAEKVTVHKDYDRELHKNDLAIIKLIKDTPFNEYIQPITLPTKDIKILIGEEAMTSGWSDLTVKGGIGSVLRYMNSTINDILHCFDTVYSDQKLSATKIFVIMAFDGKICLNGVNDGTVCKGDSGGPLVVNRNGRDILVGVTSNYVKHPLGSENCTIGNPALFTSVPKYLDWIINNM